MKYILIFLPILSFAQAKTTPANVTNDSMIVHDLGPVYENILQQQEQIKKQYDEAEKSKQAFIVGYFAGKGRVLTERDSIVFVGSQKIRILQRKKK